jgi:hypothetical protein
MSYQVKLKKGSKGKNVKTLKIYLNVLVQPSPKLKENETFDQATHQAVIKFETQEGFDKADGVADAKTWAAMGKRLGHTVWLIDELTRIQPWILNLATRKPITDGPLNIDREAFFQMYMEEYGPLDPTKLWGLDQLLEFIDLDPDIKDVRWAAYMLATVKHECADKWQPIEEFGKGAGHDYGKDVTVTGSDGKKYTNKYYGRGYVQLTWKDNYDKMSKNLGLGDSLLIRPAEALDAETAYKIMSYGMRNGSFTGKKLSDYIHDSTVDYKNARRIINGLDQWQRIKGYAEKLEAMLTASLKP